VLAAPAAGAAPEVHALVRLAADPDRVEAELSLAAEPWVAALGAPRLLLERAVAYARSRGIGELGLSVAASDTPLLELCKSLGFAESPLGADAGAIRMRLVLGRYNPK
jgi:acetyltransferase